MRATKGYCYTDIWNFNTWFCGVVPPMLRYLADNGCAYSGISEFDTPEKWHNWLHSMADTIHSFNDEELWLKTKNEYYKEWNTLWEHHQNKHPNITMTCEYDTSEEHFDLVRQLYYARAEEISKERQELINNTFKSLSMNFDALWD